MEESHKEYGSIPEAARILGVSANTMRSILERHRKEIRSHRPASQVRVNYPQNKQEKCDFDSAWLCRVMPSRMEGSVTLTPAQIRDRIFAMYLRVFHGPAPITADEVRQHQADRAELVRLGNYAALNELAPALECEVVNA